MATKKIAPVTLEKWRFWDKPRRIAYFPAEDEIVLQYKVLRRGGLWYDADEDLAETILEFQP